MVATTLQELLVKFTGDATGLANASNQAKSALNGVEKAAGWAASAVKGLAIGVATTAAFKTAQLATGAWAADLKDLADTVGITASNLQAFQYVAVTNGSSVNEFNAAILRLTSSIGEAATSGGPLLDTMNRLGISIFNADGSLKSVNIILPQVADAIRNAGSQQERLNIATDFFGRSAAPSMVRMLSEGGTKLNELQQAAKDTGKVLTDEMINKADKIDQKWQMISFTLGTTVKGAVVSLTEYFSELGRSARNAYSIATTGGKEFTQEERDAFLKSVGIGQQPSATLSKPTPIKQTPRFPSGKSAKEETAEAKTEVDKLNSALMYQTELLGQIKTDAKNTFSEFVNSVSRGTSAIDALKNAAAGLLGKVGDSLMNMAFGGSSGGGLGGLIGGEIGKIFGGVTATSGPAAGQVVFPTFATGINRVPRDMMAMVHKGEQIIPARDAGKGGGVTIVQNNTFGNGVTRAEIASMLPQISKASVQAVGDARTRGVM